MSVKYTEAPPDTVCTPDDVVECWKCCNFTTTGIDVLSRPVCGCALRRPEFPNGCEHMSTEAGTDPSEFEGWLKIIRGQNND